MSELDLLGPVVEAAPIALIVVARDGTMRFVNRECERLFGYARDELAGRPVEMLIPESARGKHAAMRGAYVEDPRVRKMGAGRELHARQRNGNEIPVEVALKPFLVGGNSYVLAVVVDISERKALEHRFEIALEAAPIAMLMLDAEGRILLANREAEALYGYTRRELVGQPVEMLVPERFRINSAEQRARFFASAVAQRLGSSRREFCALRKDGREVPVEMGLSTIRNEHGAVKLVTVVDVSEQRLWEAAIRRSSEELETRVAERTAELAHANRELDAKRLELERLSREDPLTGLANRRAFDERLADEIQRAERLGTPLAAAMFDLDHFKRVNDTYGHAIGDVVLRETAKLLRHECRTIDTVARYGGEEFALAIPGADMRAASALCERIRQAIATHDWPKVAPGLGLTISGGVGVWHSGAGAAELLGAADRNLYTAKHEGRNRIVAMPEAPGTKAASG